MDKKYISIQEAINIGNGKVNVRGWVWRERGSNKIKFIVLRDSSNIIQCVIEKDKVGQEKFEIADKIQIETSMKISGNIRKEERSPSGYEINVDDFEIVGTSFNFPIQKDLSEEYLLDVRHLWLRSRKMTAILKIRSTVFGAIHEYFRSNGFYEHQSPCFTSTQAEGGSTLFTVNYFGRPMYLTQTWQLYAEAVIFALEKIYCIAPSFRAEKSKTSRHLTEYWHAEMEIAWCDFEDIMNYGEALIKHVIKRILEKNMNELLFLKADINLLNNVISTPFIRMSYDDALKILKEKCNIEIPWGKDLRTIEEDALSKLYKNFIIVYHYPKAVKAFYMKEVPGRPEIVQGCDFIAPDGYGEIIGGSQREEKIEEIEKRLKEQGENLEAYSWYLDTRRYGSVPHGGFGLGVERLISFICHLDNIKDAIAFPRTMYRTTP